MSTTMRWVVAVVLIIVGIGAAAAAVFGGAFSTVGCLKTPPDWVYYILFGAGLITLAACLVPAVMLLRRARGTRVLVFLLLGIALSCGGYGTYVAALTKYC